MKTLSYTTSIPPATYIHFKSVSSKLNFEAAIAGETIFGKIKIVCKTTPIVCLLISGINKLCKGDECALRSVPCSLMTCYCVLLRFLLRIVSFVYGVVK